MHEQPYDGLSLFGQSGNRKYLNAAERQRFVEAARRREDAPVLPDASTERRPHLGSAGAHAGGDQYRKRRC